MQRMPSRRLSMNEGHAVLSAPWRAVSATTQGQPTAASLLTGPSPHLPGLAAAVAWGKASAGRRRQGDPSRVS